MLFFFSTNFQTHRLKTPFQSHFHIIELYIIVLSYMPHQQCLLVSWSQPTIESLTILNQLQRANLKVSHYYFYLLATSQSTIACTKNNSGFQPNCTLAFECICKELLSLTTNSKLYLMLEVLLVSNFKRPLSTKRGFTATSTILS